MYLLKGVTLFPAVNKTLTSILYKTFGKGYETTQSLSKLIKLKVPMLQRDKRTAHWALVRSEWGWGTKVRIID
jgi:hypothetical protein